MIGAFAESTLAAAIGRLDRACGVATGDPDLRDLTPDERRALMLHVMIARETLLSLKELLASEAGHAETAAIRPTQARTAP